MDHYNSMQQHRISHQMVVWMRYSLISTSWSLFTNIYWGSLFVLLLGMRLMAGLILPCLSVMILILQKVNNKLCKLIWLIQLIRQRLMIAHNHLHLLPTQQLPPQPSTQLSPTTTQHKQQQPQTQQPHPQPL